jgi:hypothetical protein
VSVPRVLCLIAAFLLLAVPSSAQAAGWLPPTGALNGTHAGLQDPKVAVDDAGNVYAAWLEGSLLEVSKRPVGGVFETPQTIAPGNVNFTPTDVDIGVDGAGNAVLVWRESNSGGASAARQALRPAAGSAFGQSAGLGNASNASVGAPDLDVNRAGQAVVGFSDRFNATDQITAGIGSASAGFVTSSLTVRDESGALSPQVAINEAGDAAAVWLLPGATASIRGTYRARGNAFEPGAQTIQSSTNVKEPDVAIDSASTALATWVDGVTVRASTRAATPASWSNPQPLDTLTSSVSTPRAAFDAGNGAAALWAGDRALRFSILPGAAQTLAPANEDPQGIEIASSQQGTSVGVWSAGDPGTARAVVRPTGGAFGAITTLSLPGTDGVSPDVAVDPRGNAAAVWVETSAANPPRLLTAEYDATAPSLTNVSVPEAAQTGEPVAMSASAGDDWSVPVLNWTFGDGATGTGASVSHIYDFPGEYAVTATAVDAAGNTTVFQGVLNATAPVVPPPNGDPPTRGVDFNASSVSGTVLVSIPRNAPAGRVLARRPVARAAAAISPPAGYLPFRLLGKDDSIPVGSILDASRGISSITMAANRGGSTTQKGQFSKGVFKTKQSKASPLTTATMLGGGNFKRDCKKPKARAGSAGATAARRRPSRRLFANVKGRFRTRGRHSTATVRGTQYLVKDSCSGTTTRVVKGSVVVRDLVKHRSHIVRAGHRFIARPRKR